MASKAEQDEGRPARKDRLQGCLLGMAVGDALGLPMEGLSRRRVVKLYPDLDRYHLLAGKGFCSDDTEHACLVAQALIHSAAHGDDVDVFTRDLAWRLRFWLLGLPAGIGMATLKGALRLWLGFPPGRAGVNSAGNGPAMRAPLLGVRHGHDADLLTALVRASTRLTHTDPRAEQAAHAIALAAHCAATEKRTADLVPRFLERLSGDLGEDAGELVGIVRQAVVAAAEGIPTEQFAAAIGCGDGVSGYSLHTVPVALHAWLRHPEDYRAAVQSVIRCGGDTDTVAALTGALVGARVGKAGIPPVWLDDLAEWPRSVGWMERLCDRLAAADCSPQRPLPLNLPALLLRNILFLAVVLGHGFRRLLPPY